MAFSVFSKPLSHPRWLGYNAAGAAIGAGVGSAVAGKDRRGSGAAKGASLGYLAGDVLAAAHAMKGTGAATILKGSVRDMRGSFEAASSLAGRGAGIAASADAGIASVRAAASAVRANANLDEGLKSSARLIGGLFRKMRG